MSFQIDYSYTEKSIAVFGDTKDIKDDMVEKIGGRFNANLTNKSTGSKAPGWIFPKTKEAKIKDYFKGKRVLTMEKGDEYEIVFESESIRPSRAAKSKDDDDDQQPPVREPKQRSVAEPLKQVIVKNPFGELSFDMEKSEVLSGQKSMKALFNDFAMYIVEIDDNYKIYGKVGILNGEATKDDYPSDEIVNGGEYGHIGLVQRILHGHYDKYQILVRHTEPLSTIEILFPKKKLDDVLRHISSNFESLYSVRTYPTRRKQIYDKIKKIAYMCRIANPFVEKDWLLYAYTEDKNCTKPPMILDNMYEDGSSLTVNSFADIYDFKESGKFSENTNGIILWCKKSDNYTEIIKSLKEIQNYFY